MYKFGLPGLSKHLLAFYSMMFGPYGNHLPPVKKTVFYLLVSKCLLHGLLGIRFVFFAKTILLYCKYEQNQLFFH